MKDYPGCVLGTHNEETTMRRQIIKLEEDDVIRDGKLSFHNLELVTDEDHPDKVEIYMIDQAGNRIEGGTFSMEGLIESILKYYNENY